MQVTNTEKTNSFSHSMLEGTVRGIKMGTVILGLSLVPVVVRGTMEIANRALGHSPSLPITVEECRLAQFKDCEFCAIPLFDSTDYTIYLLAGSVFLGTFLGAVDGVVQKVRRKNND